MSKPVKSDEGRVTSPPAYIMDLEDIVRMRDLEVRALKDRIGELEEKVAGLGDAGVKAQRWQALAVALMAFINKEVRS